MLGNECQGGDCCASPVVTGTSSPMSFKMGGVSGTTTAEVATFALDKFEVTVGRFRNFQATYEGHPANNAGAHPLISGSGWQSPAWDGSIAPNAADLARDVQCNPTNQRWTRSDLRIRSVSGVKDLGSLIR